MISSTFIRAVALAGILILPMSAQALLISGDITGGGSFSGAVTSSDAWVLSNPLNGEEVNFWTLFGNAGDKVSMFVNSGDIEFGMSLYFGEIDDFELLVPGFNNVGDFADNMFVAGTPGFATIGTELLNIILPSTGLYTLGIGGEEFFNFGSHFAYDLGVHHISSVPAPATAIWLLVFGLIVMWLTGRRNVF